MIVRGRYPSRPRLSALVATALLCVAGEALADPPARVARIAFVSGAVSFRQASLDEWTAATLNYPMTTGDHLWTDSTGRAELQLGSTAVRLAPNTAVNFITLDDRAIQLRLAQGTVFFSVRDLAGDEEIEVDTPNGAISLPARGVYRLEVNLSGDETAVTVRQGEADVTTEAATFSVAAGFSAVVHGLAGPTHAIRAATRPDEWEDWCQWRERRAQTAVRYVSPGVIGAEDLDEFGSWQAEPEYGTVWVPNVHVAWAPYRFGHWSWVAPWGWTWIDDAWWGFAPFHYGRWAWVRARWVWVPGVWSIRPIYAPALVVFVGGSGWDVSVAIREPIGWFPLGPREPFMPPYGVQFDYIRAINRPYVNLTNRIDPGKVDWVNRLTPNGVTVVPSDLFRRGRYVGSAMPRVPEDAVRRAPILEAPASMIPDARPGPGATRRSAPPPAVLDRPVIAHRTPPAVGSSSPAGPSPAGPPSPRVRTVGPPPPRRPGAPPTAPPEAGNVLPPQRPAPPSPREGDLAARQAAARARLEAEHDAEQARTRARQAAEENRSSGAAKRGSVDDKQARERQSQDERQKREHEKTDQRQARERKPPASAKNP